MQLRYEVLSPSRQKDKYHIGLYTESPVCIDSLDMQKELIRAGHKINFTGTEAEYQKVKSKLFSKVKVTVKKEPKTKPGAQQAAPSIGIP